MTVLTFRLAAPLQLPNRQRIAANWRAGAAEKKKARALLSSEIAALTVGQRPAEPWSLVSVQVFRHSIQEPDTDNLYASVKGLLDCLQPATQRRTYGLGIIANDKPSACELSVRHVKARHRTDQCTVVVIRELAEIVAEAAE